MTARLCNVCADPDLATFEAGGLWWCDGCAAYLTDVHLEDAERGRRPIDTYEADLAIAANVLLDARHEDDD